MKLTNKLLREKRDMALTIWRDSIDNDKGLTGDEVNEMIQKAFGSRLNVNDLYRIKRLAQSKGGPQHAGDVVAPINRGEQTVIRNFKPDPLAEKYVKREILVAIDQLLGQMRTGRLESITIHASGVVRIARLESREVDVHLGGRRADDPPATVAVH